MPLLRYCTPVVVLLLLCAPPASAQLQWSKWFFGYRASLDFAGGVLRLVPGSVLNTLEGSAAIADPVTGELYFYTDGRSVWNASHRLMPSGGGLGGHSSSTQSALIVPDPGDAARFYVFTADAFEDLTSTTATYEGISVSIVDMTLDGGRGDVVVKSRRLAPLSATEKLCAIRRCTDGTYWVIAHEANQPNFYAYHVTAQGISEPVVSRVGLVHRIYSPLARRVSDLPGQMKSSPDGSRIAVVQGSAPPEIFDFNQQTGELTLAMRLLGSDDHLYGVSFSPDGTRLYALQNIAGGSLLQWDLTAGSAAQVSASRVVLAQYSTPGGALQLGIDGRLYVAIESRDALDVVAEPNRLGAAARLLRGEVGLGGAIVGWGLPNVIETELGLATRSFASADTVICPGESVQLSVSGTGRHRWSPASSLSCSECASPIATPDTTTRYVVETETATGCVTRDTVVVTVHDAASVDAGGPRALCLGDTATLQVRGGVRWEWSPAAGLSCTDCAAPRAAPSRTTTYVVRAFSAGGCLAVDSVLVAVNAVPRVVARGDTTVCVGVPVALAAAGAARYRWEPSTGLSCSDCPTPVATTDRTTVYRVIGTTAEGCSAVDSVRVTIAPTSTVRVWIDPSTRAQVSGRLVLPVLVDDAVAIAGETSIELDVSYDDSILLLAGTVSTGTIAAGGEVLLVSSNGGRQTYRIRPGPVRSDTLVKLSFRTYLADTLVTDIGIALRPNSECLTIDASGGSVRLDSLCGIGFRLIDVGDGFAMRGVRPNPFETSARIDFATVTPSHVRLRIVDAAGREVLRPIDGMLEPGDHTAEIDGALLPMGLYVVRLESDGSVASGWIVRR